MYQLRRFWQWLTQEPPAAATPRKHSQPDWDRVIALMNEKPERVEYAMPKLLPGVLPKELPEGTGLVLAMDSGYTEVKRESLAMDNGPAAWGGIGTGALGPGLAFLGFPYLAELAQITEYRTPAESLSTEMTRTWLRLKSRGGVKAKQGESHLSEAAKNKQPEPGDDPNAQPSTQLDAQAQKIKDIDLRLEQLRIRDLFREATLKTEQFGRAHMYVSVKDQDELGPRQLPLTEIKKGELIGFTVIEPYWLTPYSWNATHPERPDFYKPQSWFVLGRKTHHTRLLTFIFREVPDLLKPAYDFAGISMTQLMMPYVNRWLRTAKNVNDLINIFSIVTLATDLQAYLQDAEKFRKRMTAFTTMRDNRGFMAINRGTEELSTQNVPLSSLDKLQAQAQEHMATPGRLPLIKFFGITPTGLNTTSEGEFQAWYDYAHALQELGYTPLMQRVLELVQMDMYGSVDDDITFEWLSLYEPTPKEKGEMRKADADRDKVFIDAGVVSQDEVRERLRSDPESGYTELEGPAPPPPAISENPFGNEGGEGDEPEIETGDK